MLANFGWLLVSYVGWDVFWWLVDENKCAHVDFLSGIAGNFAYEVRLVIRAWSKYNPNTWHPVVEKYFNNTTNNNNSNNKKQQQQQQQQQQTTIAATTATTTTATTHTKTILLFIEARHCKERRRLRVRRNYNGPVSKPSKYHYYELASIVFRSSTVYPISGHIAS